MQMQAKAKAGCMCKGIRCGLVKSQTPSFVGARLLRVTKLTLGCLTKQLMHERRSQSHQVKARHGYMPCTDSNAGDALVCVINHQCEDML